MIKSSTLSSDTECCKRRVIPAGAGMYYIKHWIPAFAGMTTRQKPGIRHQSNAARRKVMYKLEIRTGLKRGEADIHTLLTMWRLTRHRMSKLSRIFCCIFIIFTAACTEKIIEDGIVEDILLLEKPKSIFDPIDIYPILEKHIHIGMPEKDITAILIAEEFYPFIKYKSQSSEKNIKKVTWIRDLDLERPLFTPILYRVAIKIDVTDQKVSAYSGAFITIK